MKFFCFFQFCSFFLYLKETILYLTCFFVKLSSCCVFKSNFIDFSLLVDLISFEESISSQIEYSMILTRTIDSQTFQFFEKLSLSFRFVFDIALMKTLK